jgi:hypothetical protein
MAYSVYQGHLPEFLSYVRSLYRPALTLWFLYALAIMFPLAKVFSRLRAYFLIPMLVALYVLSATSGEWTWGSFPDRIARLSLMFAVGSLGYKQIASVSARYQAWWPSALALYGIGSYLIFARDLMDLPYVALVLNALGVWSIILFARSVADSPFSLFSQENR